MADYRSILLGASTTLGAVILTWLLHYFPERRRQKKEKEREQKLTLLSLIREFMDNIFKISSTPNKHERQSRYNKTLIDAEYLDEVIRLTTKIPDPEKPDDEDVLVSFLSSSLDIANDFVTKQLTSKSSMSIWIIDYRMLCAVITGGINLPITVDIP